MQLNQHSSVCPLCGGYLSGGQPLPSARQLRCPACLAGGGGASTEYRRPTGGPGILSRLWARLGQSSVPQQRFSL